MIRWKPTLTMMIMFAFACCGYGQDYLLFPKGSPPARAVDLVDLRKADPDTRLAATTLIGRVNNGKFSTAAALFTDTGPHSDVFWMDWLKQKKYIQQYAILSTDDFFKKYSQAYSEVIVYDPNLPATINIASMIASTREAIVVAPTDVPQYGGKQTVTDLRGRWKKNVDAYQWAFANLWPKMNHQIIACYHPTDTDHHLRDYLVRHKIFTFWVTGKNLADDITSNYEVELKFANKLWAACPPNIPMIGWIGGTTTDHGLTEYYGVGLAGQYGIITAGSNWGSNLSFYSGVAVDVNQITANYSKIKRPATPTLDRSKVYLTFAIVESGDSPVYWQGVQKQVWDDPNRGQIPIGWSLGPPVFEMLGPVIEYFYEKATPNDYFFLAPSGNGYVHPYRDFMDKTANPQESWNQYLRILQTYIDTLKLHELSLYTDAWLPFDRAKNDPVTLKFASLSGIDMLIMGMGRDENALQLGPNYTLSSNNVMVSHVVTRWDPNNVARNERNNAWLADEIRRNAPAQRPAFITVHPLSWSYYPSDLVDVAGRLGSEYVVVSPPALVELYKKSEEHKQ